jgi:hypothetical protein
MLFAIFGRWGIPRRIQKCLATVEEFRETIPPAKDEAQLGGHVAGGGTAQEKTFSICHFPYFIFHQFRSLALSPFTFSHPVTYPFAFSSCLDGFH